MQLHSVLLHGSKVEFHMQVGRACASLHVEDAHRMLGIVLKYTAVLCEFAVYVSLRFRFGMTAFYVVVVKQVPQSCILPVYIHFAGPEVHTAGNGAVDAAQVDYKLIVHVEPEVVIT